MSTVDSHITRPAHRVMQPIVGVVTLADVRKPVSCGLPALAPKESGLVAHNKLAPRGTDKYNYANSGLQHTL